MSAEIKRSLSRRIRQLGSRDQGLRQQLIQEVIKLDSNSSGSPSVASIRVEPADPIEEFHEGSEESGAVHRERQVHRWKREATTPDGQIVKEQHEVVATSETKDWFRRELPSSVSTPQPGVEVKYANLGGLLGDFEAPHPDGLFGRGYRGAIVRQPLVFELLAFVLGKPELTLGMKVEKPVRPFTRELMTYADIEKLQQSGAICDSDEGFNWEKKKQEEKRLKQKVINQRIIEWNKAK